MCYWTRHSTAAAASHGGNGSGRGWTDGRTDACTCMRAVTLTSVFGHEALHLGRHHLVEVVLARDQRLADGRSVELHHARMTSDLVHERLQLHRLTHALHQTLRHLGRLALSPQPTASTGQSGGGHKANCSVLLYK